MKYYILFILLLLIDSVQSQIFFQSEVNKIQERYRIKLIVIKITLFLQGVQVLECGKIYHYYLIIQKL